MTDNESSFKGSFYQKYSNLPALQILESICPRIDEIERILASQVQRLDKIENVQNSNKYSFSVDYKHDAGIWVANAVSIEPKTYGNIIFGAFGVTVVDAFHNLMHKL